MSDQPDLDDLVTILKVPEANTNEMINALSELLDAVVDQIPFKFSCGDLMSAMLYGVVETGMQNTPGPEKLRADIVDALDRIINDVVAQAAKKKGSLN